jgi:pimeloyl-ACP methyl ester carboxylesterase
MRARSERGINYQHNRTIGLRKIYQNVIVKAGILETGVCNCRPEIIDRITLPGGFETVVYLYDRGGEHLRPGIVLIHGNVWNGQNLSTYRILAKHLSQQGYIVATFDKIGFGLSDDPLGKGPAAVPQAYDRVGQVREIVNYMKTNTDVDPQNITLFGHSGGVTQALELGQISDEILNVVIMVAPNPPMNNEEAQERVRYFSNRFSDDYEFIYGRALPDWFKWELTEIDNQIQDVWTYFRQKDHKPLFLILGEEDEPAGHGEVISNFETLTEPKEFLFIDYSDHYLISAQTLNWVFYDKRVIRQLIDNLVPLLKESSVN